MHDRLSVSQEWACKSLLALNIYSIEANFFWAFNEGLYIMRSVVFDVFATNENVSLYYAIGWGK